MNTDCLTLEQLQRQLTLRGITLTTDSGNLVADDPAERLTPMLDRAIRHHRKSLLRSAKASLVAYRAADRQEPLPELLRAVQVVKELFDGVVIEPAADTVEIPMVLLKPETKPGRCNACGQDRWWSQAGRRICRVCHPPPLIGGRSGAAGQSTLARH